MALNEGEILAGKYRIERLLGEGGMGAVYVATNQVLQKRIALKVMNERFAAVPAAVERFLREAVAASRVSHAGIVQVFDAGEHEGKPWIAMELLEGESLGERLERGPMSLEEVLVMADGALSALAEVHEEGIIHRDLKPDNIFLARVRGGGWVPKVLDFGVAKDTTDGQLSKLTATGAVVGTAHYLSPEQAKGLADIDARADVYAMGVVLFEALSGWMPYEADSITQLIAKMFTEPPRALTRVAPQVPSAIADVVATCLEQDRDARFQTARALLEALRAAGEEAKRAGASVGQGVAFAATAVASVSDASASASGSSSHPSLAPASRSMHATAVLAPPDMPPPPDTPAPKRSRAGLFAAAGILFVVGALATVGAAWLLLGEGEEANADLADAHGAVARAEAQTPLEPEPSSPVVPSGVDPSEALGAAADDAPKDDAPEDPAPEDDAREDDEPADVAAAEPTDEEAPRRARRQNARRREPQAERREARAEPEEEPQPQEIREPQPPEPEPAPATPARPSRPQTGIAYAQVMGAVRGQLPRMQERCYERRLRRVPNLAGVVTLSWTVTAAGRAEDIQVVHNGTGDDWLARCARNIVADTRFPSASNGMSTPARYPFQFRVQ